MKKDTYMWKVVYEDGSYTTEFDEERPDGRGFAEREQKKILLLSLLLQENEEAHFVLIPDLAEPIFFRRRKIEMETENTSTVHCIGWKKEEQGVYLFITDTGSTLLTNDLQAV